jgi:hypothetical protein
LQTNIKTTAYSIEFSHIYTDEEFNANHIKSAQMMKELSGLSRASYSTILLIDDYNADQNGFDLNQVINQLAAVKAVPDFYAYESDLVRYGDALLASIQKPKILRMYASYIKRKDKYPCSLLTATWYLIRLGYIDGTSIIKPALKTKDQLFLPAEKLINILPTSFKDIERDAHRLIGYSAFADARFKIEPILFDELEPVRAGFVPERVETAAA